MDEEEEEEDDESIWSAKDEAKEVQKDGEIQIGKRLALTNIDWDNITAVDILALFSSLCKGDMFVEKV